MLPRISDRTLEDIIDWIRKLNDMDRILLNRIEALEKKEEK
tara:strand:- start:577 stop:699 length:123 start_codon:yes stop_codon:yes gene_type:complete